MGNIKNTINSNTQVYQTRRSEGVVTPSSNNVSKAPSVPDPSASPKTPKDQNQAQAGLSKSFHFDSELKFEMKKKISSANQSFAEEGKVDTRTYKKSEQLRLKWSKNNPLSRSPEFQTLSQIADQISKGWITDLSQLTPENQDWLKRIGIESTTELKQVAHEMRAQEVVSEIELFSLEKGQGGLGQLQALTQELKGLTNQSPPLSPEEIKTQLQDISALSNVLSGQEKSLSPEVLQEVVRRLETVDQSFVGLMGEMDDLIEEQSIHQKVEQANEEIGALDHQLEDASKALSETKGLRNHKARKALKAEIGTLVESRDNKLQEIQPIKQAEALNILKHMREDYAQVDGEDNPTQAEIRTRLSPDATRVADMIDYYNSGKDPSKGASLDHNNGMDYVYTELMANFSDTQKTEGFYQLIENLDLDNPGELSSSDKALLEDFGLVMTSNGLFNIGSREKVSAQDLQNFKDIIDYQKSEFQSHLMGTEFEMGSNALNKTATDLLRSSVPVADKLIPRGLSLPIAELVGTHQAIGGLASTQGAKRTAAGLGAEERRRNLTALTNANAKTNLHISTVETELGGLQANQKSAQAKVNEIDKFIGMMGRGGQIKPEDLLNGSIPAEIVTALRTEGFDITQTENGVSIAVDGKEIGLDAFFPALEQKTRQMKEAAEVSLNDLNSKVKSTESKLTDLKASSQDLSSNLDIVKKDLKTVSAEVDRLTVDLARLNAQLKDPTLSADQKLEIKAQISSTQTELKERKAELSDIQSAIKNAEATLERSSNTINKAVKIINEAKTTAKALASTVAQLNKLEATFSEMAQKLSDLRELDQKTRELMEKADKLEETLTLAARPDNVTTESLFKEWQGILEEYDELIRAMNNKQLQTMTQERKNVQKFVQDALKNEKYHLNKLASLDQMQVQALESNLKVDLKAMNALFASLG